MPRLLRILTLTTLTLLLTTALLSQFWGLFIDAPYGKSFRVVPSGINIADRNWRSSTWSIHLGTIDNWSLEYLAIPPNARWDTTHHRGYIRFTWNTLLPLCAALTWFICRRTRRQPRRGFTIDSSNSSPATPAPSPSPPKSPSHSPAAPAPATNSTA